MSCAAVAPSVASLRETTEREREGEGWRDGGVGVGPSPRRRVQTPLVILCGGDRGGGREGERERRATGRRRRMR